MQLITKELENQIPKLYEQDNGNMKDVVVYAHYFAPISNFDWFVFEYDSTDKLFFGFANLNNEDFAELGYFSLEEFESLNKSNGFGFVEREINFQPKTVGELSKEYTVLKKLL